MRVRVKLIATYRQLLPPEANGNTIEIDVPAGSTIADILGSFGVPLDSSSVILLNGRHTPLNTSVQEGDEIAAFSAVAGG